MELFAGCRHESRCENQGLEDHHASDEREHHSHIGSRPYCRMVGRKDRARLWLWSNRGHRNRNHWRVHRGLAAAPIRRPSRERNDKLDRQCHRRRDCTSPNHPVGCWWRSFRGRMERSIWSVAVARGFEAIVPRDGRSRILQGLSRSLHLAGGSIRRGQRSTDPTMGGRNKRADIGVIAAARAGGEAVKQVEASTSPLRSFRMRTNNSTSAWSPPSTSVWNERISTIT